jgi:hypothetical protein
MDATRDAFAGPCVMHVITYKLAACGPQRLNEFLWSPIMHMRIGDSSGRIHLSSTDIDPPCTHPPLSRSQHVIVVLGRPKMTGQRVLQNTRDT